MTSAEIDWVLWSSLLELRQELSGVATDFRVSFEEPSRRCIKHATIKELEVRIEEVEVEIAKPGGRLDEFLQATDPPRRSDAVHKGAFRSGEPNHPSASISRSGIRRSSSGNITWSSMWVA